MQNSNPTLNERIFVDARAAAGPAAPPMTWAGFMGKTAILFGLLLSTAAVGWFYPVPAVLLPAMLVGLGIAFLVAFKPTTAPVMGPIYALLQGYVVGAISVFFARSDQALVPMAIALTLGVFVAMYGLWATSIIRVTSTFTAVVVGATLGICITYLFTLIGGIWFPGLNNLPIYQSGAIGIAFSLLVVGVASLNLALDFQLVRDGVDEEAPKYMEWYGAFSLMVTLVWLYISMLRLLNKIRG